MIYKKSVLLVIFIILTNCNKDKKDIIELPGKKNFMKKIDSYSVREINKIGKEFQKKQIIKDDSIIELSHNQDYFFEAKRKKNELIYNKSSYDKETHIIVTSLNTFRNISIGTERRFNKKGEVIFELNHDQNFEFTIYDLINKLKITNNLDLNNEEQVKGVDRKFDNSLNKFVYYVRYKKAGEMNISYIILDGQNGEILDEGLSKVTI